MALTKEEIAAKKAEATGKAASGIAHRESGGGITLSPKFEQHIGGALTRDMILAAVAMPSWKKALEKGGVEAVAHALYLCRENNLKPHRKHVDVMQIDGVWQAQITAFGYGHIASQVYGNDGRPRYHGNHFSDAEVIERGPEGEEEPWVIVRCTVFTSDGASFEGVGRKPRYVTVGVWEGPKGDRRKVGEKRVFDANADSKAETAAARRAFEKSPFASLMPREDDQPREPQKVRNEAEPAAIERSTAEAAADDGPRKTPSEAAVPPHDPASYADMRPQPLERVAPPVPDAGEYEQPPIDDTAPETAPAAEPVAPSEDEIQRANETTRLRGAASVVFTSDVAFANWIEKKMWGDTRVPVIPEGEDPLNHAPLDVLGEWVGELEKAAQAKRRKQ